EQDLPDLRHGHRHGHRRRCRLRYRHRGHSRFGAGADPATREGPPAAGPCRLRRQRPRRPRPADRPCRRADPLGGGRGHRDPGAHRARRPGPLRQRRPARRRSDRSRAPRRRFRDRRAAADPRRPREGRGGGCPQRPAGGPAHGRRPVRPRLRPGGGPGLPQGGGPVRDRAGHLLGDRGPGVRRHPADHQERAGARGGVLRRQRHRLAAVRRRQDARAALGHPVHPAGDRRPGEGRPRGDHAGRDDPGRDDHRAGHDRVDARR
ncbi:MAG: Uroporphyrinogen-III methyltransferase / Uroporphyrinogen-III synthase, partial [uncultured Nocardioidaceae bacterium]